ncbi:MAG: transposase [Syntrophobacteraceae bacterium]|nr:transposase [Syntrophobacteraceae bacterium]
MITGIVLGRGVQLPDVAAKIPAPALPASREKKLYRCLKNEKITHETYFLPCLEALLSALSHSPLIMAIDGSAAGRNCVTLMVALVYRQRALPIAWTVIEGKKGHFPEEMHVELVRQVQKIVPEGARVVVLGDGEFDGINLQAVINQWRWGYVVRTAKTAVLTWEGHEFSFDDIAEHVIEGDRFEIPGALFTRKKYGPIHGVTWWRKGCQEPIHLVTNLESLEDACRYYTKRFKIETFFSDQKSRGFNLHKSHISEPERLSRLMIAACLAYLWMIYLGATAIKDGLCSIVHRTDRCDLSLFRLGLRLLTYMLVQGRPLCVAFCPPE